MPFRAKEIAVSVRESSFRAFLSHPRQASDDENGKLVELKRSVQCSSKGFV